MIADSSNIANKNFSKSSKEIDKKLIILVLVFFLAVSAILYYSSQASEELESSFVFILTEERKQYMCDWDCSPRDKLIIFSKTVREDEPCTGGDSVTIAGKEYDCSFLARVERSMKERRELCKKDYVFCEEEI